MNKITEADALRFAEAHFPNAPEKLAEHLDIQVRSSQISCDGYCLPSEGRSLIRINSAASAARRRFTLAHELGHLVLGIPTVVGETMMDSQRSKSAEEKQVNKFAEDILLPVSIAKQFITEVPVTASVIKATAKKAKVSKLFAARRLASIAKEIGLKDGLVVFYKDNAYAWQWSDTIGIQPAVAQELLAECLQAIPHPAKFARPDQNDYIVASLLENPYLDMTTVFVQVVDEEYGLKETTEEQRRKLEAILFADFPNLKQSFNACLGMVKIETYTRSTEACLALFNAKYLNGSRNWDRGFQTLLKSEQGQDYLRLRLKAWAKP